MSLFFYGEIYPDYLITGAVTGIIAAAAVAIITGFLFKYFLVLDRDQNPFSQIVESSLSAILVVDENGKIELVNTMTERLFGYSREELIGRSIELLVPAPVRDRHEHFRKDFFKNPETRPMGARRDLYGLRKDGTNVPVSIGLNPIKIKSQTFVLASIIDITERKLLEDRYRYTIEAAMDAVVSIDTRGRIIEWNKQAEAIFGWRKTEVLGRTLAETIIPLEFRERHTQGLENYLRTGEGSFLNKRLEIRALHRDGHEFPVELTIIPVGLASGIIFSSFIRDITERRNAQERLEQIVEAAPNANVVVDQKGKIVFLNKMAEKMLGYSRDELLGETVEKLVPLRFREKHGVYRDGFHADPKVRLMGVGRELFAIRKDGAEVPVEIGLNPIHVDSEKLTLAAIMDITERKRATDLLVESEKRFRTMADSAPVLIRMTGPDGAATFFNKSWLDFTGRTAEQESGCGWLEGVHTDDCRRHSEIFDTAFRSREKFRMDYRLRRYDGEYRWLLDSGAPLFSPEGEFVGYVGSCVDITELKKAQEILTRDKEDLEDMVFRRSLELVKTRDQLKQANRLSEIGTLAATVAHELRNPLGVIQTALFNLKRKAEDARYEKHFSNIEKKIYESNHIINNLLNYAKIKLPQFQDVQLAEILRECVSQARSKSPVSQIHMDEAGDIDGKPVVIQADPVQLKELFSNILDNACHAIGPGSGEIWIAHENSDPKFVNIVIRDNGPGIPAENQERIFQPFFTTKSKGTGLGLAICSEIINLHGGRITVTSREGQGAEFTLSLPK